MDSKKKSLRKEQSTTGGGAGAAGFTAGTGAQYATPFAFNKNKKAKGTADTYAYRLSGFKPVKTERLYPKTIVRTFKANVTPPTCKKKEETFARSFKSNPTMTKPKKNKDNHFTFFSILAARAGA